MATALLLIDLQNDYFPGGAMELDGAVEAAAQASRLLAAFRAKGLPVVHIQHLAKRPGATFFLPGTPGAEIRADLQPREGEPTFVKHFPNAFRDTPLLAHLRGAGVERLVVAGMMTHMCIDTSVRAAFDLGFACTLAGDASATRDLMHEGVRVPAAAVHAAFLAALHGTFAQVRDTGPILADL